MNDPKDNTGWVGFLFGGIFIVFVVIVAFELLLTISPGIRSDGTHTFLCWPVPTKDGRVFVMVIGRAHEENCVLVDYVRHSTR